MAAPKTIRELLVRIGVKADDAALKRVDAGLERAKGGMGQAVKAAALLTGTLATLTTGLAVNARAVAGEIESTKLLADALGITTEQYQRLAYAGSTVGANAELVRVSLGKLSTVIQGAREGEQGATDALKAFGLTLADIQGMNPAEVFARVADSTKGMEDPFKRSRAAARLFGEEAVTKLVPLLQQGSAGLAMLGDQASAAGAVLGEDAVQGALAFQDAQNQLMATVGALRTAIGVALLPALTRAIDRVRTLLQRPSVRAGLESTVRLVGSAVDALVAGFALADRAVTGTLGGWDKLLIGIAASLAVITGAKGLMGLYTMAAGLGAVVTALGGMLGLAGAPLWAAFAVILAAIAATVAGFALLISPAVLAFQDLYTWVQGGDSAFGRFLERFPDVVRFGRAIADLGRSGGRALMGLGAALGTLGAALGRVLAATPGGRLLGQAIQLIADAVREFVSSWADGQVSDFERLIFEAANGAERLAGWMESLAGFTDRFAEAIAVVANDTLPTIEAILAGFTDRFAEAIAVVANDTLPTIEAILARITPSFESFARAANVAMNPGGAALSEASRFAGAGNVAAAFSPSAAAGGAAARGFGNAAAAGVSRISNRSASLAPTINITSTDPMGAAREVEAAIERAARSASAMLLGGER